MPRLAFYLNTDTLKGIDLRGVDGGNPGIGGSEYLFFLIAKHLARHVEVHFYATRLGPFPGGITYHEVRDLADALAQFRDNGERLVVLRESEIRGNAALLRTAPQKFLAWAHNYSNPKTLKACQNLATVARYLCVSREQYEQLRDEPIFAKSCCIPNTVVADAFQPAQAPPPGNTVFFMGNIIPQKGFHVLARHWPAIRRAVPDAQLHIVGSGQLYDRGIPMGPLGLAAAPYERQFARYLTRDGVLRDDVVCHGTLGADKNDLLRQAKVAVVNPTGVGETFCMSALEFELLGVPVVTKDFGGPRNVVQDGRTGILFRRERQLGEAVIRLLRDDRLRAAMSAQAVVHGRTFDVAAVIPLWVRLVEELERGEAAAPDFRTTVPAPLKRAKDLNRRLRALPGLGWLPSVDCLRHALRKRAHSLFVRPWQKLRGW